MHSSADAPREKERDRQTDRQKQRHLDEKRERASESEKKDEEILFKYPQETIFFCSSLDRASKRCGSL